MKILAIALAVALSAPALATQSHAAPGANAKEVWRAKAHRELVKCAGFYYISYNFFRTQKPEIAKHAMELGKGAIYFISQLKVPEADSDRHLADFQAEVKREYNNSTDAYPRLFNAYAKRCDVAMNGFAAQYTKHMAATAK